MIPHKIFLWAAQAQPLDFSLPTVYNVYIHHKRNHPMTEATWQEYKIKCIMADFLVRNYYPEFSMDLVDLHPLELLELIRTRWEDINYGESLSYYLNLAAQ
jgi:hypothetical protein